MSLVSSSVRSRLKRPTVLLAAGVAAAALVFGGTLAANAAPGPSLTLAPTTATVNGTFDATVDGFQPNELVTFTLGSETQTGTTDGNGQLKESLWVPQGTALGPVTVQATGTTTPVQSAQLTVVAAPVLKLSATTVTVSQFTTSPITATVTGFAPGEQVQFGFGAGGYGGPFGAVQTADAKGTATISFKASDLFSTAPAPGTYAIVALSAAGNIDSTRVSLTVVADPAATPAAPAKPATPIKQTASFTG